jgi:hypothetical protein
MAVIHVKVDREFLGIAFVDIFTGSWYIHGIIQIQTSDHSFGGANVADRQ